MDPSSGFLSRIDLLRGINSAAELIWMHQDYSMWVSSKVFDPKTCSYSGKHIPVKVDVSGAAGPHGGLDGAPCGSWRKKEEYCSHSGQAWKGTKEQRRTKQVIDDLLYLDPWKMDHVKCCWLEFFLVLEDL